MDEVMKLEQAFHGQSRIESTAKLYFCAPVLGMSWISFAQRIEQENSTFMSRGNFNIPYPVNEPVLTYAPGTAEREEVLRVYRQMYSQSPIDVPMYIGGDTVRTENKRPMAPPHDHQHILGHFNYGDEGHVKAAIDAAMAARPSWSALPWNERAAVFSRRLI